MYVKHKSVKNKLYLKSIFKTRYSNIKPGGSMQQKSRKSGFYIQLYSVILQNEYLDHVLSVPGYSARFFLNQNINIFPDIIVP